MIDFNTQKSDHNKDEKKINKYFKFFIVTLKKKPQIDLNFKKTNNLLIKKDIFGCWNIDYSICWSFLSPNAYILFYMFKFDIGD